MVISPEEPQLKGKLILSSIIGLELDPHNSGDLFLLRNNNNFVTTSRFILNKRLIRIRDITRTSGRVKFGLTAVFMKD